MPPVPGIERLPPEHRAWLLREWRRTGWGDNARIAQDLNLRLSNQARDDGTEAEAWDASTIYRWARVERTRTGQIRFAAELRAATIAALPDDDPGLADRVGAYMEGRLVEALEDLDAIEALDPLARIDALTKASQATTARRRVGTQQAQADLARAKWESEQQIRREERAQAADRVANAARGQGVSADGIAALRAAIEGAL